MLNFMYDLRLSGKLFENLIKKKYYRLERAISGDKREFLWVF